MKLSAVSVHLSALGDLLLFFFGMYRILFVIPTVGSGNSTSCETQPNVGRLRAIAMVAFLDVWSFFGFFLGALVCG